MKFSYPKIFLLGFGFFGVSVIWMTYNSFVPLFLANRFALDVRWIGFFMTLDNIAALLIQPPVGAWSDRLRTPIGRRLPFILVGAPVAAVAFGLIPLVSFLPLFSACTISMLLSMAFWRTPVVALMPDVTPSQYRSQANGIINFMGGLGAIIGSLGGAALYKMNPAYPFWLGSLLLLLATTLVVLFVREQKQYEKPIEGSANVFAALNGLWRDFLALFSNPDRSALRILGAIFFWFVAYNAIEAFFTLYAQNQLGLPGEDGARLLGQLSLLFVLFALPSGYIGARLGRRNTILTGLAVMTAAMLAIFFLPKETLVTQITRLPVLGVVPVIGCILMLVGAAWALINVNSLPMVVDMTESEHIGTYTGLYYFFSTLAAITGPNINSWIIALTGNNYNLIMIVGPIFMAVAAYCMFGVRKGEAVMA